MPDKTNAAPDGQDLHTLTEEVKRYLQLQKRYLALNAVEKVTCLLSAVAVAVVCLMLGAMALCWAAWPLASS